MRVQCSACKNKMQLIDFATMALGYLAKQFVPVLLDFVVQVTKAKCQATLGGYRSEPETRGFFDNKLAFFANGADLQCPACKKVAPWVPAPEDGGEYDIESSPIKVAQQ